MRVADHGVRPGVTRTRGFTGEPVMNFRSSENLSGFEIDFSKSAINVTDFTTYSLVPISFAGVGVIDATTQTRSKRVFTIDTVVFSGPDYTGKKVNST